MKRIKLNGISPKTPTLALYTSIQKPIYVLRLTGYIIHFKVQSGLSSMFPMKFELGLPNLWSVQPQNESRFFSPKMIISLLISMVEIICNKFNNVV